MIARYKVTLLNGRGAIVLAVDVESAKIIARDMLGWTDDLSEARVELWDSVRARLAG